MQPGVHYQPIVGVRSGAPTSVEALIRPDGIRPSRYVAAAERRGRMRALTEHVVATAAAELRGLGLRVAVNVSPSLLAEGWAARTAELLDRVRLDPAALVLEITEAVAIDDLAVAAGELWKLQRLGVTIALDDFGRGWSSASRVDGLPLDVVKLDRAFVDDDAKVRDAARLCAARGMTLVVEGIEDAARLEQLDALGAHEAQGFAIAQPMPSCALVTWLDDDAAVAREPLARGRSTIRSH